MKDVIQDQENEFEAKNVEVKSDFYEKIARLADLSLNIIVKAENGVNTNPIIETLT